MKLNEIRGKAGLPTVELEPHWKVQSAPKPPIAAGNTKKKPR